MSDSFANLLIQVISLEDDCARRINLRRMFVQEIAAFNFVDAVDLRNSQSEQFNLTSKTTAVSLSGLSLAEYGCMLSHVKALNQFLDTEYDFCLVLEDDVVGDDSSIACIRDFIRTDFPRKVFALCGGQDGLKNTGYVRGYHFSGGWFRLSRISRIFLARTCCYLVDRDMARSLLVSYRSNVCRADDWVYLLKDCKDVYYRNLLSHPIDLSQSHIERSRKELNRGFWFTLVKEGVLKLFFRSAMKLCSFFVGLFGLGEKCSDLTRFPYPFQKKGDQSS